MLNDDAAVDLLEEMLCIPSLCGQENEIASLLLAVLERAGFDAARDEVGNVIGTADQSAPARTLMFLGHMDTVPGKISVRFHEGKLYGRGSVDAKGPLAAALVAAIRAAERTRLRLTFVGAVQEEGPSLGARHLATSASPDYLVICEPSGWDAVVMGYKGSQRFTVEVGREPTHTAHPDPTAPERLVAFWNRLVTWCEEKTGPAAKPARRSQPQEFDRMSPTLISMHSENDGRSDTARMHISLRLPPGVTVEAARDGVRSLVAKDGADWDVTFSPGEEAIRGEKGSALVSGFLRAIRNENGTPRFKVKTGTSDMNVVGPVWHCPMLAYGPGDSHLDHTRDEHIEIDEYLRGIRVLTRVLEELE
jgi:LysW-gamma-L-lysine carboxypeptidase